ARIGPVLNRCLEAVCGSCGLHPLCQLADAELLRELVEDPELATVGCVEAGELDAAHGVADVEESPRLATLAVNGQGIADRCLRAEAVEDSAPDVVVVESCAQLGMHVGLGRARSVDPALVEIGGAKAPDR